MGLSPGKWTVFVKSYLHSSGAGDFTVHCTLRVGNTSGGASTDFADADMGSPMLNETISLNAAGPVSGRGGALLQCSDNGGDSTLIQTKITAMKAGTLNIQAIS